MAKKDEELKVASREKIADAAQDVTQAPQATTQEDVAGQDTKTRLWQSLNTTYGNKIEESNKAYDQNYSQAARDALSRGMGRSSYALATQAGILGEKAKAADRIRSEQIADYQNRLTEAEAQERQEAFQREQFEEGKRQFNENMAFQQSEAARSQGNADREFEAGRSDTAWNQRFQERQFNADQENAAWNRGFQEKQFNADQENAAWNRGFQERQYADSRSDTAWNQRFQEQQFGYQQERDKISDAQWQKQFEAQQAQWREEFDYNRMSNDQKLAYSYIENILAAGGNPTDELLRMAGLSRDDYNEMKKQAQESGIVPSRNNDDDDDEKPETDPRKTKIAMTLGLMSAGGGGSSRPSYYNTLTTK